MKNVHTFYKRVTEEKNKNLKKEGKMRRKTDNLKKEGKTRISIFIFISTLLFACLTVYTKFHNPKSSSC